MNASNHKIGKIFIASIDQLGKSKAGAVVGGLGGAVIGGAYAEKALKTQTALEYIIELKNGENMSVVQGTDVEFAAGGRVMIVVAQKGRSRVVADRS